MPIGHTVRRRRISGDRPCVANKDDQWYVSVGARSGKAKLQVRQAQIRKCRDIYQRGDCRIYIFFNMRGSEVCTEDI
ncbi:MAG: hypothetical protein ACLTKE_08115 [Coprococcus sp.]